MAFFSQFNLCQLLTFVLPSGTGLKFPISMIIDSIVNSIAQVWYRIMVDHGIEPLVYLRYGLYVFETYLLLIINSHYLFKEFYLSVLTLTIVNS